MNHENNYSCFRRDMPAHASDFSLHMKGLFQRLLVQENTISALCNWQCQAAVDKLAREIAYPLYEMLAENLDTIEAYKNKNDLHRRLSTIWELIRIDDQNMMNDDDSDSDDAAAAASHLISAVAATTAAGAKERRRNNRTFLLFNTPCATLLSDILAKSELFTEAHLKMTLLVFRALFFGKCSVRDLGFEVPLKKVRRLFSFLGTYST